MVQVQNPETCRFYEFSTRHLFPGTGVQDMTPTTAGRCLLSRTRLIVAAESHYM